MGKLEDKIEAERMKMLVVLSCVGGSCGGLKSR